MPSDPIKILEETSALLTGHFKLTSGRHSDRYVQCAQVFQYPDKVAELCRQLADKLPDKNISCVIGPAVGGIIFAYAMAGALGCRTIYAERVDEKMAFRRNFFVDKGEKVIVVEDVVTTGGSALEVAELAKSMGAEVVAICSLVDRSAGKVAFPVPFVPLISMDVVSWEADSCPLCKDGKPIVQPGSRHLKL